MVLNTACAVLAMPTKSKAIKVVEIYYRETETTITLKKYDIKLLTGLLKGH